MASVETPLSALAYCRSSQPILGGYQPHTYYKCMKTPKNLQEQKPKPQLDAKKQQHIPCGDTLRLRIKDRQPTRRRYVPAPYIKLIKGTGL